MAQRLSLSTAAWLCVAFVVSAQNAAADAPRVTLLADGLPAPTSVDPRPGTRRGAAEVYLADGKSISCWREASGQVARDLVKPPAELPGATPAALACLAHDSLAVAWRSRDGDYSGLGLYAIDVQGGLQPISFRPLDAATKPLGQSPVSCFYRGTRFLFVCGGDPDHVTIVQARHNSGMLGEFRELTSLKTGGPAQITMNPEGYLLIAAAGRLAFYDPSTISNGPRLALPVGIDPLHAVAYSPTRNPAESQLFALADDGLYRLDSALGSAGRLSVRARLVADVDHPTAMAFAPTGELYVAAQGGSRGAGVLLKVNEGPQP